MIISEVKTKTGTETINAYSAAEVVLPSLTFSKKYKKRQVYLFADTFAVFDSETAHTGDSAGWLYQWAFKLGDSYVYGRTPSEFINLLERMKTEYALHRMKTIIIYVHNLSYDMQYLKWHLKNYDDQFEMFAVDSHGILSCDVCGFRFICSYRMSNLNLDTFAKNYASTYIKASGAIDYDVVRYQDSELTCTDWLYMFSDVASQYDAIDHYLLINGYDRAYKAPITSTGFVRTDCRKASEKETNYRKFFKRTALDLPQYKLLNRAFAGGLTIASYKYAGITVTDDHAPIKHKDFNSSYPARIMMNYFPVGKPFWYGDIETRKELETLLEKYCCVFILTLKNVHIKDGITAPCIPSSKCMVLRDPLKVNGKIVFAEELSIAVTEIDYKWIRRQYTADSMQVSNMLCMGRGSVPNWLKTKIMFYYERKCTLKKSDPVLYQASKALLNGIYGMTATRICRPSFNADSELILTEKKENEQQQIERYYNSFSSFMPYQFGVYTTAWARDALLTMIECVGYDNFLYCDTDSVFYISTPEAEKALADMNRRTAEQALKCGAFIGDNVLGVATDEPDIRSFRALHAKCYAMEEYTDNGETELKVTIAGIPKKSTKWINGEPVTKTNAEELGTIDRLEDGFIFRHCGGTRSVYIEQEPTVEMINGHRIECASACVILPIEKEISDTMWAYNKDLIPMHIAQSTLL